MKILKLIFLMLIAFIVANEAQHQQLHPDKNNNILRKTTRRPVKIGINNFDDNQKSFGVESSIIDQKDSRSTRKTSRKPLMRPGSRSDSDNKYQEFEIDDSNKNSYDNYNNNNNDFKRLTTHKTAQKFRFENDNDETFKGSRLENNLDSKLNKFGNEINKENKHASDELSDNDKKCCTFRNRMKRSTQCKRCPAGIVKLSSANNLSNQSKGVKKQINDKINEINRMSIEYLDKQLDRTRDEGFKRNHLSGNTLGIHAMKQGSLLDGCVTIDLNSNQNDKTSPGSKRGIFQTKYKRGQLIELKFIGVGDTHGDGVQLWKDISQNDKTKYLKVTNAADQEVAILKLY
jgi:hypothetical protein